MTPKQASISKPQPSPAVSPGVALPDSPVVCPRSRSRVSLIVPTYNGAHLLPACLDAVARQTRLPDETIVVDDASTDETERLLSARYPWARVVRHAVNQGFVSAVNSGIGASTGQVVALLNNDTEPEPHWLEALVRPLEEDEQIAFTASKLLLFDRRDHLHSAGDGYSSGGVPINRGAWTPDDARFNRPEPVFGACGGAVAYRRAMLDDLGGFDPWFVSYLEDTDLNWRAQLRGYRCLFVPQARVYHRISATSGGIRPSYFCGRNFLLVLASDVPGPLLRKYWWQIVREQGAIVLEALRHIREPAARARLRGYAAGLALLPAALRRRRLIQATRRVPVEYLDRLLTTRA